MGRCGCGHLFPSFCLETKGPILRKPNAESSSLELCWGKAKSAKLKIQGRHHRSQRTKRALPRHVGQARAPCPVDHRHSRTRHKDRKQHDNGQRSRPLPSWRTRIRHPLRSWDSLLSSLRVIARRNDEAIHLWQIDVRFDYVEIEDSAEPMQSIYFQKSSISFPITYPTANDSKRLQSTTNVCSTDRSWQTMHLCDIIQTHLIWPKRILSTKSNQQRFHFLN